MGSGVGLSPSVMRSVHLGSVKHARLDRLVMVHRGVLLGLVVLLSGCAAGPVPRAPLALSVDAVGFDDFSVTLVNQGSSPLVLRSEAFTLGGTTMRPVLRPCAPGPSPPCAALDLQATETLAPGQRVTRVLRWGAHLTLPLTLRYEDNGTGASAKADAGAPWLVDTMSMEPTLPYGSAVRLAPFAGDVGNLTTSVEDARASAIVAYHPANDRFHGPILARAVAYVEVRGSAFWVRWSDATPCEGNATKEHDAGHAWCVYGSEGVYVPSVPIQRFGSTPEHPRPYPPAQSGFFTKGDNRTTNTVTDQVAGLSHDANGAASTVQPAWIAAIVTRA